MQKNNKEKIKLYATAIYQNAMVGVQSINDIMDKITDINLKHEVQREQALFKDVSAELEEFATNKGFELKENNLFEKTRLWASINMSTMFNQTTRHIAELMLVGTVMGLITCYKDKYDHKDVSEELDGILDRLEKIEDDNYLKLKTFLKNL